MSTYTMKKKRRADTNKKNGANVNSSNTSGNNNNNVIVPPDKHHNGSTPCSNSAVDIINEIFPSIAISAANLDGDDKVDSGGGKQKGNKNKSDIPTENNTNTTAAANKPEPPLLGRMIQKYLLDERKSIRGVQSQQGSGGGKKKKKNKKKKKKSANKVAIEEQVRNGNKGIEISLDKGKKEGNGESGLESPPTGVTAASTYDIEDSVGDQNIMGGAADQNAKEEGTPEEIVTAGSDETTESQRKSPDSVVVQTIGLSEVIDHTTPMSPPPLSQAQEIKDESPSPTAKPNKENNKKEGKDDEGISGLDRLLDSIIDSPQPSSTQTNEIDKGRELQAFTNFLSKKLELYIQDKKKSESNGKSSSKVLIAPSSPSSSSSTTYTGGIEYKDVLPTISMSNATTLITSTDCRKCRTASQIHLRNLTSDEKQHFSATEQGFEIELKPANNMKKSSSFITLNVDSGMVRPNEASPGRKEKISKLSVPVSDRFGTLGDVLTDDIEGAFNYRNMDDMVDLEAGVASSVGKEEEKNESFKLQLRPLSMGSDKEKYFQIGLSGDEQSFPISTKDIIGLVKHVLVPCGLGEGEDDGIAESIGRDDLGDKELAKIALQVKKRLKEIEDTFKAVKMKLYGIRTGLEEIDPVPRSSFDMKTSKMLMGFDEQLDLGFKQLGDLLLQIFKLTSFVGWSATRGFKFSQFTFSLLERFNHALDTLIDPVQQYRGNLIRATGRDGQVPQIYKHRVSRDGLQKLIEIKMNILGRLSQDMERAVTIGFQDGETSCMVEILVLQEYRRYTDTMNQDGCSPDKVFPDESSETQMTRLIAARINLAVSTIRKPTVLGMQDKSREICEDVTSLCKNIRKIVIAMEDSVSETKVGFLEMCYEKHESIYYEIEKNQRAGLYNDRGEEACDTSMLLRKSNQLMMQWLILLCSRQCNGSSQEFVTLPRDADKWLDSIVNADITKPGKDDKKACDGGNGQRRVSSVLAALIYRWLEERCKEWNAELTRDELLQSIGMDEPAVGVNEGGASAKSGKKKKSKRKGKNKEKNVVVVESSTDVVTSTDKDDNVEVEITKEEKKDDIIEVSLAVEEEEAASIKLAESLVAMDLEESITTPTPSSPEGEWKVEKKTKRKGAKGQKNNEDNKKQSSNSQSKKVAAPVKDTTSGKKSEDNAKTVSSKPNKKQVEAAPVKESSTAKKQEGNKKSAKSDRATAVQTSNNTNVTKKPEVNKKSVKSDQQQDRAAPAAKQSPNADKPEASKSKKSTKSKSEQSSSAVSKEKSSGDNSGAKKQPVASEKDNNKPSAAKEIPTKKTDEGKKKTPATKQNPYTDEKSVSSKKSSQVSSKKPDVQSKPQEETAPIKSKADNKKPVNSEASDSQTQVVSGKESSKKMDTAAPKTEKKKKKEDEVVKVDAVIANKEQAKDQVSEMNQVEEEEEDFYFTIDEPDEERPTSPPLQAAFSVDAPDELVCPISLLLMTNDPVVAADGITYERASIEDWFSKSEDKNDVNSPVHGTKMPSLTLTPNISVRNMARALAAKSKSKQVPSTITTDQSSIPTQHDDDSNSQQYAYPPPPYGYPPAPQHYGYPQMPPQYNYPNGGTMPPPQYNYPPAPPNQQVPPQYGGYPPPQYYPPPPNMDPNMMHHHYAGQVPYHPGYPYPTVGIEDRQQVMAPEMYLVQRLEKVASNDSGDNENGKEDAPIVWL